MILLPIPYHAALALMKAGRLQHRPEDIVCFASRLGRGFLLDQRTKYRPDDEPDIVYPLGRDAQGRWFWICPTCGAVHAMTRKQIKQQSIITCENQAAKYHRFEYGLDGEKGLLPPKGIRLIADIFGW